MSRMLQFVSLIFQGFPNMHRSSMQHDCMFPRGDDAKEIDTAELSVVNATRCDMGTGKSHKTKRFGQAHNLQVVGSNPTPGDGPERQRRVLVRVAS